MLYVYLHESIVYVHEFSSNFIPIHLHKVGMILLLYTITNCVFSVFDYRIS